MTNDLARYDAMVRAIADAERVDEIMMIHDEARALKAAARVANDRDALAKLAAIQMRAARRLGTKLGEAKAAGMLSAGGRPKTGSPAEPVSDDPPARFTLAEIGVDKKLSSEAQRLAALPEGAFEEALQLHAEAVLSAGARAAATISRERERQAEREAFAARTVDGCDVADLAGLVAAGKKFRVILADPPWAFQTWSERGQDRAADRHYRTDPLAAIAALPVAELAADDCVLLLWATWPMMREALDLIDAWQFDYKTCGLDWMKLNPNGDGIFIGNGYWFRSNTEPCLLATRGKPLRLDAGVPMALLAPVGEHSAKPDEAWARIERLVGGPYLELYARRPRPGWTTWGNEIDRAAFAAMAAEPEEEEPTLAWDAAKAAARAAVPGSYAADRSVKWNSLHIERVRELAAQSLTAEAIGERLGMPRGAVKGIARRNGIELLARRSASSNVAALSGGGDD